MSLVFSLFGFFIGYIYSEEFCTIWSYCKWNSFLDFPLGSSSWVRRLSWLQLWHRRANGAGRVCRLPLLWRCECWGWSCFWAASPMFGHWDFYSTQPSVTSTWRLGWMIDCKQLVRPGPHSPRTANQKSTRWTNRWIRTWRTLPLWGGALAGCSRHESLPWVKTQTTLPITRLLPLAQCTPHA